MMIEFTFVLKAITNIIEAFIKKEDFLGQNRVIFQTLSDNFAAKHWHPWQYIIIISKFLSGI